VNESQPATSPIAAPHDEFRVRVLLVDDQALIGEAIRRILAAEPLLEFRYCGNPADALEVAESFKPTVILQDLVMPNIDGLTLLRAYRAHPPTADIPVIVLSTKEEPTVKRDAFVGGANDYLIKLPDAIELIARIRHHSKTYLLQRQRDAAYRDRAAAQEQVLRLSLQQQQLEEMVAQRLDSVGQLAAGVAHEINTPVQYVSDYLYFIREGVQQLMEMIAKPKGTEEPTAKEVADVLYLKDTLPGALTGAVDGLTRIAEIVRSMKEFSHADDGAMSPVDLHRAVQNTLIVARSHYVEIAEVEAHYDELPEVYCYGAEINQVLLNLVTNASEAIAEVVKTTGQKGLISIRIQRDADDALISIGDTGAGIPEVIQSKIFDPFFTTKEVGKGTGQGLSIARNIVVRRHGGALGFQTTLGKGTQFVVRLPLTRSAKPAAA
jgi:two-component system, NtrC family, sensor kinase